jgi:KEOPS complex subunit Pcc1
VTAPHRTVFTSTYADSEQARRVARSLGPELDEIDGDRTTATLTREDATLTLTIRADDLTALRAGCTTWLTLTDVAEATGAVKQSP